MLSFVLLWAGKVDCFMSYVQITAENSRFYGGNEEEFSSRDSQRYRNRDNAGNDMDAEEDYRRRYSGYASDYDDSLEDINRSGRRSLPQRSAAKKKSSTSASARKSAGQGSRKAATSAPKRKAASKSARTRSTRR